MIAIGPLMYDFEYVTKAPHGDGPEFCSLQRSTGKYLSVSPEGIVEERDTAGAWERFRLLGNFAVTDRGAEWPGGTYAFPVAQ